MLDLRGGNMQTYGRLQRVEDDHGQGTWVMEDVPPHVRIRLKSLFAKIDKAQVKVFTFPDLENVAADLSWFLIRYPMEMSEEDRALLVRGRETFEQNRIRNEEIMLPDWQPPAHYGFKPDAAAKVYLGQKQAAEMLLRLGRLLVMDDVGLGKTWIALYALAASNFLPAAIVVNAHMPKQWVEEFIKPLTYMSAHIINGTKPYTLPPANLYIFRYTNVAGWADIASTGFFKSVVFDEVQDLRTGEKTNKGRSAKVFSDNAQLRVGLSASPIFNYGSEIFNILEFIEPGVLGTMDEFTREWCHLGPGDKWVVTDPQALGTHLRELQLVIRRERQGRKVNKIPIELPWDDEAAKEDDLLSRKLAFKVLTGSFEESGQASRELDMRLRRLTGVAKARGVAAYARVMLEAKKPIILFGWHRDVYTVWLRELAAFNPIMFTGSETGKQKEKSKRAFMSGDSDCLLMSLRSGAGIDGLQKRCSTVLFGELDWTPKVHDPQCIGRVDRPGQTQDEIEALYFWTNGGSDPDVMSVHGLKASQAQGVVDPLKGVEKIYTDHSRVKALAKNYLERHGVSV